MVLVVLVLAGTLVLVLAGTLVLVLVLLVVELPSTLGICEASVAAGSEHGLSNVPKGAD